MNDDRMRLDLEMECAGFYVCVKCLQHNLQLAKQ